MNYELRIKKNNVSSLRGSETTAAIHDVINMRWIASQARNDGKEMNATKSGFTLIEIMVAISIFSIVMVIVIGALLLLNDANKKAQALRAVVDNLNFAIEDMTRNIRTGKDYRCGVTLSSSSNMVSSISTNPNPCNTNGSEDIVVRGPTKGGVGGLVKIKCYLYKFVKGNPAGTSGTIKYSTGEISVGSKCDSSTSWKDVSNLVSPEVDIKNAKFYVVAGTGQQPIVIISISGEFNTSSIGAKFKTPFDIQTTVSQRSDVQ